MRQPYGIKQDVEALLPLHPVKVLRGALLQIQKQLSVDLLVHEESNRFYPSQNPIVSYH